MGARDTDPAKTFEMIYTSMSFNCFQHVRWFKGVPKQQPYTCNCFGNKDYLKSSMCKKVFFPDIVIHMS